MKKHICIKCRKIIYEELTNYPQEEIVVEGICAFCSMKPDEKKQLKRDAEDWRNKKTKEIMKKENPTEMEKHILNLWNKK